MKNKVQIKKIYPLTPMQQGMLFHSVLDKDSDAYFEQTTLDLKGNLSVELFEQAFNLLIKKYDVLRTVFKYDKTEEPLQIVIKERTSKVYYEDIRHLEADARAEFIKAFQEQDRRSGFDLQKDVLMRISVLRAEEDLYKIIWSHHHIIMDGWCMGIVVNDIFKGYRALRDGTPLEPEEKYPFGTYVQWQKKQNMEDAMVYWRDRLKDFNERTCVPQQKARGSAAGFEPMEYSFRLGEELSERLKAYAVACGVPINTLYQAVWGTLLQKYNNTDRAVFGMVVSGRTAEIEGIEEMVGLFINTVPVYVKAEAGTTFSALVKDMHNASIEARKYEYCSLADVQTQTGLKQNLLGNIMVVEDYPLQDFVGNMEVCKELGFRIASVESFEQTNYDFNIDILPGKDTTVQMEYNNLLYDSRFIAAIEGHFKMIAQTVLDNSECLVEDIEILTGPEKERILFEFNNITTNGTVNGGNIEFVLDKALHEHFEEHVERNPEKTAIIYGKDRLSYRELNARANRMASYLRSKGVTAETLVAVLLSRCPAFVEGVLGIWKAGGAYIPLDTEYPLQRKLGILKDSKAGYIITLSQYVSEEFRKEYEGNIICLDLLEDRLLLENSGNLSVEVDKTNLAYVLFTSGSTGKPKGVMIEHMGMLNHILAQRDALALNDSLVFAQNANQCFDISVWQFFGALALGGTTAIYPNEVVLSPAEFTGSIQRDGVTLLEVVPSYLTVVMDYIEERQIRLNNLNYLIVTGEAVKPQILERWFELCPGIKVANAYGPAEASDDVTQLVLDRVPVNSTGIPIGKPMANTRIYIADNNMKPCPVGVAGEICVAGTGVGRGYINDPVRTGEAFIRDAFTEAPGARLYKTGDLGKWLPDGNIEFIGRKDFQVKVRGYRIELSEIENVLSEYQDVKDTVVADFENDGGNRYICAYFSAGVSIDTAVLKQHALRFLPEYMVPSYYIQLDMLPLLPNGKVDRKALPKPETDSGAHAEYQAPQNENQRLLAEFWESILGVKKAGIKDNFFELGGHSLLAIKLVSKIKKEMNVDVPLHILFSKPTIEELALYIQSSGEKMKYSEIKPVEEREYYELSSAQRRLFIVNELAGEETSYNMPVVELVEGRLDIERFKNAIYKLVERHDAFRTSFELRNGTPVQIVHMSAGLDISVMEASQQEARDLADKFIRPFDLAEAPLLRVGLIRLEECKHVLMIDMHHIISDGMSMDVFIKEFLLLYKNQPLEPLKLQYKDFSAWQNSYLMSDRIKSQEEYWLNTFRGELPDLNMPIDFPRPAIQSFEGGNVSFSAGPWLLTGLRELAAKTGSTLYMIILAAYNVLLHRYTGQEDIIVGSPVAGRPHADLEDIVGVFVNTLAMRNFPASQKTFRQLLAEVRDNSLHAFENQDYQFEELIDKLGIKRDVSRNPLFDTMFVMQNTGFSKESDIKELRLSPFGYEVTSSMFDITLNAVEDANQMNLEFEYSKKLFKRQTVERLAKHLINIMSQAVKNPEVRLSEIEMLSEDEKNQILGEFNNTKIEHDYKKTVTQLFEEQAAEIPDNIALQYQDSQLTYGEVAIKAARLAGILRGKGVKPNDIVGIMVERSFEMVIGILAILKAGGAYMPINPEYPAERVSYMLEDSGAFILLTKKQLLPENNYGMAEAIYLEDESLYLGENSSLDNINSYGDTAYIIYTSGSTGKPKGVLIRHCSVVNILYTLQSRYPLSGQDTFLLKTAYTFDVSVAELFGWFIDGGRLAILKQEDEKDPQKIAEAVERYQVTHINFVPSMFNLFAGMLEENEIRSIRGLKYIFLAGEAVTQNIIEKFRKLNIEAKLENIYGPTEATIYSTAYSLENYKGEVNVSIGKPLDNLQAYIVSPCSKLQPIGVAGELCISGIGLAKGYLNNEKLTDEKFIENPFSPDTRMYKTGDLARWLPDGDIEYLGRMDNQVKIRGFRIELGEIGNALLNTGLVNEAVLTAVEDAGNEKVLCAYYTAASEIKAGSLRQMLSASLPDYMIPLFFIQLDKIPLNPNGKINRKALPKPLDGLVRENLYTAPENSIEEKLAQIWQEILGVDKIGTVDNFFELGGHSLKATMLMAQIHKEFKVQIPLKHIFLSPTIKGIARLIPAGREGGYDEIRPVEAREYYPVSSAQRRMYILNQLEEENTSYNIPAAVVIEGQIETSKLEDAFNKLVARHELLRASFEMQEDVPVLRIHENVGLKVEYFEAEKEEQADLLISRFVRPFDLGKAPLMRAGLIRINPVKFILVLDMHHIISDGTSMDILIKDFTGIYKGNSLQKPKIQYKDYAVWHNELLKSEAFKAQEAFWLNTFSGEIPTLDMPADFLRPTIQSFEGSSIDFKTDKELTAKIKALAAKTGTTLYMVLLAAYNVLLHKYTGQEDIIVGTPIAGREHADLEEIVGMFVNTVAMRNYPNGESSFLEFLSGVRENTLQVYENQGYQFEELVDKLEVKRDLSRNALFDTMFVLQNTKNTELVLGDTRITPYKLKDSTVKFDLLLDAVEEQEEIRFVFEYCTKLYTQGTVEKISRHFINILSSVCRNPQLLLSNIEIMGEEESRRILVDFNSTQAPYPKEKTINQVFEEQVEKTPSRPAVLVGDSCLTYAELNQRVNCIAQLLSERGVGPDDIVAIMLERSFEMIIGVLGILKAGGAYLPISPAFPPERIKYMLSDSKAKALLLQKKYEGMIKSDIEEIAIDDQRLYERASENPPRVNNSRNLAYIIYTSGSTGKPKGVMIEHYSVINRINWMNKMYPICKEDIILQKTPFTFDVSVWELFWWAFTGSAVCMLQPGAEKDPALIVEAIEKNSITTIHFVPSMLSTFLEHMETKSGEADLTGLRQVFASGEALTSAQVNKFNALLYKNYGTKLHNLYGPTEATVDVSYFDCSKGENIRVVPIGRPIDNIQLLVLDKKRNLLPVGIAGELFISGDGLARGYINNPALTSEKFIPNPYIPGERMYSTGDLARWMCDGNIEYLGRMDHQVKIRGFRIELGEIENELVNISDIREAVVIAIEDQMKEKALCAYLVSDSELTVAQLRDVLSRNLPEYMIPSYFVRIDKIPLSANGKVDRKALPSPEMNISTGTVYTAPENEIEEKLTGIWSEILGVERIGTRDNFFQLGGHSLKATVLVSRIHKEFGKAIPLKEIFTKPTIRELSLEISKCSGEKSFSAIPKAEAREYYPLSAAQKRLYIIQQLEGIGAVYNIPLIIEIQGEPEKEKLAGVMRALIQRHESFRTSFSSVDGRPVQIIHETADFDLEYGEADQERIDEAVNDFIKPFELDKAPLMRGCLLKTGDSKYILIIDMHHIIADGFSSQILTKEFIELYEGKEPPLLKIQYKDYSVWQEELLQSGTTKAEEEYWLSNLSGEIPVLQMPTDYPRPLKQAFDGESIQFNLGGEFSGRIKALAAKTGSTLYMVILAAYEVLLHIYTGQEDIIVGSPVAGRQHSDLHSIIGMFVNTLAMRSKPRGEKTIKAFMAEVKKTALEAFEHQNYQFEELVDRLQLKRDLSRNPLFDTMFAMQNLDSTDYFEAEGVKFRARDMKSTVSKFDISLFASEAENDISFEMEYSTRLYKRETIERLSGHLVKILEAFTDHPEAKIEDLEIASEPEKQTILREFNDTRREYPSQKTLAELFEEQTAKTPDKTAVIQLERRLTYRELHRRSDSLARVLREKGVEKNQLVGIMTGRSIEMVTGMLAILKAGGAYLPIDSKYPAERIGYMLKDGDVKVLLTDTGLKTGTGYEGVLIDLKEDSLYKNPGDSLVQVGDVESLAYVIYTSGTTGIPKGAMVTHRNIARLVKNTNYIEFKENDRILQTGAIVFDASTFEIWGALLNGLELYLVEDDTILSQKRLERAIKEYGITILWLTSPLFNQLAQQKPDMFRGIRIMFVGGEVLSARHINSVRNSCEGTTVVNVYGPTENTTFSTYYNIEKDYESNIPIGKPVGNSTVYIADSKGKLLPVGVPGELWVGGDGVGPGYLNKPELTAEKFLPDPFSPGGRIYKSGDLARWLPDGNIEFMGRMDQQVKIRGFRIELGEIEKRLLEMQEIRDVYVTAVGDMNSERVLCAYYVSDGEITSAGIRSSLSARLPEYMLPSYYIELEKLPLNQNGKIDRSRLPKPEGAIETGRPYQAPENETEEKLAEIWKQVLGLEKVGVLDNFFELGGHSLKAILMTARIHKEFGAELQLGTIFALQTVKELAEYIRNADKKAYLSIRPVEEKPYYPVSSAQKRLYIIDGLTVSSTGYNVPYMGILEGSLDTDKLEAAFRKLISRHEALRTSFGMVDGEPVQRIEKETEFNIEVFDISEQDAEALAEKFIRPFDLSRAPLLRVALGRISGTKHVLLMDLHHIITDGTSMGILIRDLICLYEERELPGLRVQYKDFAVWQNELLRSEYIKIQEDYWLKTLSGEIPVLNLATDYPRPSDKTHEGDRVEFELENELTEELRKITTGTGTTMYMILLAAYNLLLSRYTGQEDIIVGSPVVGRSHEDLENVAGMFVNTLAMRNYPAGNKIFKDFLEEVKENSIKAYENQDYQFEELIEKLEIKRDLSRNPLFDTMFAMENTADVQVEFKDLNVSAYDTGHNVSKFDITFHGTEKNDGMYFDFEYSTQLFQRDTIERMVGHYKSLLEAIVKKPEARLEELEMLTKEEKDLQLLHFNNTRQEEKESRTVIELFERQAEKTPGNIAVVYEGETLTYKELNEKANQLARLLPEKQAPVRKERIIAIVAEPSIEMIIGMLAILKAGGAYLPIDPEFPADRVKYMLEDSGAGAILLNTGTELQTDGDIQRICMDDRSIYCGPCENLCRARDSKDLIYTIYTSGTTGNPKGVLLENRNIVNYVYWFTNTFGIEEKDRTVLLSSASFDLGYTALYSALLKGCQLHIVPKELYKDPERITEYIKARKITYIKATPSLFNAIVNTRGFEEPDRCGTIRLVVLGGEKINVLDVKKYTDRYPKATIVNHYGPTEAAIGCIAHKIEAGKYGEFMRKPVIGKPVANMNIYILGKNRGLNPVGVPGELAVSGEGLSRGYLNRPELTGEKFVPNPFRPGERMYLTGDLARWTKEGTIEFIGRIDHQVKIRGYRVELSEVEAGIKKYEGVREAVVLDREDEYGSRYLCAYLTAEKEITVREIREHLSLRLPEYMIPTGYVQLEKMPLTPNGKVDRRQLLKLKDNLVGEEYVAPGDDTEARLAALWQEVLGREGIGITNNFFEMGGHSLKAVVLASRIYREFNTEMPLRQVFLLPTVRQQAEYIKAADKNDYKAIEAAEQREKYPMSSAQKRMYTLSRFEQAGINYNMPAAYIVEGALDEERLEETFKALIARHEAFRTSFHLEEGEPVQKVHGEVEFSLRRISLEGNTDINSREGREKLSRAAEEFIRPFDLGQAPLLRVGTAKISDESYLLIYDKHHIISDGVSRGIILGEFMDIYSGKQLPGLRIQYKDFAVWQNKLFEKGAIKKQEEYWLERLSGEKPVLNLPTDYSRPSIQSFEGETISFSAGKEMSRRLKELAHATGTTMYMVLMAAYNVLLQKYTGQEDIIVGVPVAGRPHADLQGIVGMFVNTLAVRTRPRGESSFRELLLEVKANALEDFANQDYPFEELVEKLDLKRDLSRNALFDTMLVMQNTGAEEFETDTLKVRPLDFDYTVSKFDLTLLAVEDKEDMVLNLEYSIKLFRKETIQKLAGHFINLLGQIAGNPDERIQALEIMSEEEKNQLLSGTNNTKTEFEAGKTIQQLFEDQVSKTPDATAIIFEERRLTYQQLNHKANGLAKELRNWGLKAGSIAAIMAERSVEMVVAMLAVLKAGGAYLPIDPSYPEVRKEYMLEDSGAGILLTDQELQETFDYKGKAVLLTEKLPENESNPEVINTSEDLAYVIYTSGSTGKPKGVMLEHRGVANLKAFFLKYFGVTEQDCILQFASSSFDASVWEIFMALLTGAALCLIPKAVINDSRRFEEYLNKNHVTVATLPPTYLVNVRPENVSSLRLLITAGSAASAELLQKWKTKTEYVNAYGPTETTVCATAWKAEERNDGIIPIGGPITNTSIYILDKNNRLVPAGIAGEICVGGTGLARGYLNRPELTEKKFISNPYNTEERIYKTGDLARWLPDGTIEFLGRIDDQVKIRGYRIELGEIESRLGAFEGLSQATVLDKEAINGDKVLCAYYEADRQVNAGELREYLSKELPDYMIPSYFIQLDKMPLTINGKIDRKALPGIEASVTAGQEYVAPESPEEIELARLWEQVLGKGNIGVGDNFFEIGGHSIKAVEVMTKINQEFNTDISFAEIFKNPTIKSIAELIGQRGKKNSVWPQENMVLIKKGRTDRENLFLIHDGSGEVGGYLELCSNQVPENNIWGISAKKRGGYAPENIKINGLAQSYIKLIKAVQPHGPYNLLGWSTGGTIAFEMVRLLEAEREQIGYFAIIDSTPPQPGFAGEIEAITIETEKKFLKDILPRERREGLEQAATIEEIWRLAVDILKECYGTTERLKELKAKVPKNILMAISKIDTYDAEELVYAVNTIRSMENAVISYVPEGIVRTKLNFFVAKEGRSGKDAGWIPYCIEDSLRVIESGGNHFTMLKGTNAAELAQKIRNTYQK